MLRKSVLFIGLGLLASAALAEAPVALTPAMKKLSASFGPAYLTPSPQPDGLALLPPPPAPGSAALARDEEAAKAAIKLRGGPRWELAKVDADIFTPNVTAIFACAAGIALGPVDTPKTDHLLHRAMADLAMSTVIVKRKYQRARPFMVNGQPNCTPELESVLRHDGSYPSGHAALGFGWSLILAELVPDRAAQLVARGRAFADSRRICNVHWLSDVEEGRFAGTANVARLHADPSFQADMAAAKAELAAAKIQPSASACAKEAAALAEVH